MSNRHFGTRLALGLSATLPLCLVFVNPLTIRLWDNHLTRFRLRNWSSVIPRR